MIKKINVLLTGASGTIGSEVLKQLHEKKDLYEITVFDLQSKISRRKFAPYKNTINIVYGNIYDISDVLKVSANQDVVIHLAAIIPPLADEKPELTFQVNTEGTEKLIRSLEKHSPNAFFIYSSSVSVYGDRLKNPYITIKDPLIPSVGDEYAKTKIEAESILKNSNLDWSIFRLSAIMGGHKISKLMFHQPLETSMEIATPEDTARAFVHSISNQNELSKRIFNLGGGKDCRVIYKQFLTRSFQINGLGDAVFKPKSFAEKNFHCGYYEDGHELSNILNFQEDTLESYFDKEKRKLSNFQRKLISIFKKPIKNYLQKQSEPLIAHKTQDKELIARFFN